LLLLSWSPTHVLWRTVYKHTSCVLNTPYKLAYISELFCNHRLPLLYQLFFFVVLLCLQPCGL
jgi:hypothetical protein